MLLNRDRINRFLEDYEIDALVSSSRENTTYLTNFLSVNIIRDRMYHGFPGSGENYVQTYGVYSKNVKDPALILPSAYFMFLNADSTPRVFPYGKTISLRDDEPRFDTKEEVGFDALSLDPGRTFSSPGAALVRALKDSGNSGTAAVDLSDMHPSTVNELRNSGIEVKNAAELFRFIRLVKSDEELSRLRASAEINERALDKSFEAAKPGMSEKELARVYTISLAEEYATPSGMMFPIGTRGGSMAAPTDSKLRNGSMFWADVSCSYLGYCADTGDSAVLGEPSEKQNRCYDALYKVVQAAEEIATPGMKSSQLNTEISSVWEKTGVTKSPTGMGHGIGLEIHEYPRISAAKGSMIENQSAIKDDFVTSSIDIPFEEGMVLNFEAPYLVRGWGGVHLEKTVILEKNGCRHLIPQERYLRRLGS